MIVNSMGEPAENRRRALSKAALASMKVVEHADFVGAPYAGESLVSGARRGKSHLLGLSLVVRGLFAFEKG